MYIPEQVETGDTMLELYYKFVYRLGKIRTHWHSKTANWDQLADQKAEKDPFQPYIPSIQLH